MGHSSNKKYAAVVANLPVPKETWPKWVVTGGGVGFLRPAPGSWGTIPPAALYCLMLWYGVGEPVRSVVLAGLAVVASVLLIVYGKWACAYFRKPDPGSVILDEYAGFAIAAMCVPVPGWCGDSWLRLWVFTCGLYVLFRATDTLKIPPGNYLERLPWGWGILLDDIAAGLQANIIAQVVIRLWLI